MAAGVPTLDLAGRVLEGGRDARPTSRLGSALEDRSLPAGPAEPSSAVVSRFSVPVRAPHRPPAAVPPARRLASPA